MPLTRGQHHHVHAALAVRPDLLGGAVVVRQRVAGVGVLVQDVGVGDLLHNGETESGEGTEAARVESVRDRVVGGESAFKHRRVSANSGSSEASASAPQMPVSGPDSTRPAGAHRPLTLFSLLATPMWDSGESKEASVGVRMISAPAG